MKRDTIRKTVSWNHLRASWHINDTHMSPLGIWAQTNIVKQNIHKTSCSPNQHAQIIYNSHTKPNICANERKYCNRPFPHTYKQKKHRTHTTHTKDQQTTFYTYTRTIINTSKHIIADKIQNIAQKKENTQSICHGNHMYEKYSDYHDVHIQYRLNTRCTHRKCNPSVISSNNNTKDTKYIAKHRETQGQAAVNTHTHTHSSQGTCPLQARMRAISGSGSGNQAT